MKPTTLTDNRDFLRVYHRGKSSVSPALVTYSLKNRGYNLRIGITSSKKVGNAVRRSRCRRVIRAAFYELEKTGVIDETKHIDIVFVCRTKTYFKKSTEIKPVMLEHLKKAGVISEKEN